MKNAHAVPFATFLIGAGLSWLPTALQGPQAPATPLQLLSPEQQEILSHLSIVHLDDGQGGTSKTIRLSTANFQIVNGLGATNGYPTDPYAIDPLLTQANSLGNLIVGYNEPSPGEADARTGSHNIVAGTQNDFTSFAGVVLGLNNKSLGPYAGALGGSASTASGFCSVIGGGSVNSASGNWSVVSGGFENLASGNLTWVGAGEENEALGLYSVVCGGRYNLASGAHSVITAGRENVATTAYSWIGGGALNLVDANYGSVVGGLSNSVSGLYGTVSGGWNRSVFGNYDWRGGGLLESQ